MAGSNPLVNPPNTAMTDWQWATYLLAAVMIAYLGSRAGASISIVLARRRARWGLRVLVVVLVVALFASGVVAATAFVLTTRSWSPPAPSRPFPKPRTAADDPPEHAPARCHGPTQGLQPPSLNHRPGNGVVGSATSTNGKILIAIGWDSVTGMKQGAVWRSPGCGQPLRPVFSVAFSQSGPQSMNDLTAWKDEFVAGGAVGKTYHHQAAAWTSTRQGQSWTLYIIGGGDDSVINATVRFNGHLVAGGTIGRRVNGRLRYDAAMWTSGDGGQTWTVMADPTGRLAGPGDQFITDLDVNTAGHLVATGGSAPTDGDIRHITWTWTMDQIRV